MALCQLVAVQLGGNIQVMDAGTQASLHQRSCGMRERPCTVEQHRDVL